MSDLIALMIPILFFLIPIASLTAFIVTLCRYVVARVRRRALPESYSAEEMRYRLVAMTVSSVILGATVLFYAGIIALLYAAVAYM